MLADLTDLSEITVSISIIQFFRSIYISFFFFLSVLVKCGRCVVVVWKLRSERIRNVATELIVPGSAKIRGRGKK
jgi:hypothetical protein